jgi:CRISPR/Cas system-associated protein endoribonuclease Cas2
MQTLTYNKNEKKVFLSNETAFVYTIENVHSVECTDKQFSVMVLLNGTSKLISVLKVPVGKTNYFLKNYN